MTGACLKFTAVLLYEVFSYNKTSLITRKSKEKVGVLEEK